MRDERGSIVQSLAPGIGPSSYDTRSNLSELLGLFSHALAMA